MKDHIIPPEIRTKIIDLGFHPVSFVQLYELWSVVGLRGEERYNIQLRKDNLAVHSIHLLRYVWNATGAKILKVNRVLVEQK